MSASSTPTLAPSAARARARLTAVVDFPTPPLPDATATMFFTPGNELDPALHRMGNDLARDADVHGAHARDAAEFSPDELADRIELRLRGIAQLDLERDAAAFHFDVSRRLGGEKIRARIRVKDFLEGAVDLFLGHGHGGPRDFRRAGGLPAGNGLIF